MKEKYKTLYSFTNYIFKKIIDLNKLYIRSPLTCKLNYGLCQLCYGWNLGNGRMVELGETVGIIAAQSIGEPGTQLTMRTFHTGGIFSSEVAQTILAPQNGVVIYNSKTGGKKVVTKFNEEVFFTTQAKSLLIINEKHKRYKLELPKNSIIFVRPKERIFSKQILAQVTNNEKQKSIKKTKESKEIKTDISGLVKLQQSEKDTKNKEKVEKLWIINTNVLSYQTLLNNVTKKEKTKTYLLEKLQFLEKKISIKKRNFMKLKTINNEEERIKSYKIQKTIIEKKELLTSKSKTEQVIKMNATNKKVNDFINVEESLETRKNIFSCQVVQKRAEFLTIRKAKPHLISRGSKLTVKDETTIKKNNNISYSYYNKQKTKDIVQGLPKIEQLLEAKKTSNLELIKDNPNATLRTYFEKAKKNSTNKVAVRKSVEKSQASLIKKVQDVYSSQGVRIADKHIEIIVKQMTSKVIITEKGDSNFLTGEIIELNKAEQLSDILNVKYEPIILGISKVALTNQSFIAEACFQETTRILTRSAIQGKIDWLQGLKENLILGNLIPAGTGYEK